MRRSRLFLPVAAAALFAACWAVLPAVADKPTQTEPIPHGQDQMPGPALSPQDAVKKMTVPDGFTVELVASEPDIVNPIAMTFDERGRLWITESLEYPRSSAGPGKDRIKILEDTHGDGKFDKVTVFADGLNIPSGLNLGYGGVWVANSPDILFLQDTKGTGKADKREVVVHGFGRYDTHELPNTLTWGPDGWLYGWNGVFNPAHIQNHGKTFDFTCAMYRINPRTREFQVSAEGTSNPWAIAWNGEGDAFCSACVIDHLWHITESNYYIRQGGPYPPFTWPSESIVKQHHQKAAYCGLLWFDSDAFPEEYRGKLFMGNIHGGCINVDEIRPDGSTYVGTSRPDFLTANDPWFMPVSQKVGPDGCLYILDWYDRYHCYQDAQRDPKGIDRSRGRIYRIRYKNSPRAPKFDLGKESDDQLIGRLRSPNVYFRETAQRLLAERDTPEIEAKLEKVVLDENESRKTRMQALWTRISCGPLETDFEQKLLAHKDPGFRAWAVRAAGNAGKVDDAVRAKIVGLAQRPGAAGAVADGRRRPQDRRRGRHSDSAGRLEPQRRRQTHPARRLAEPAPAFGGPRRRVPRHSGEDGPRKVAATGGADAARHGSHPRPQADRPRPDRRPVRRAVRRQGAGRRRDAAAVWRRWRRNCRPARSPATGRRRCARSSSRRCERCWPARPTRRCISTPRRWPPR